MYERFTDRARRVMQLANKAAIRSGDDRIDALHIFLALVEEGSGVGARVLTNLGVERDQIEREIKRLRRPEPAVDNKSELEQTPRAKKVAQYACEEARSFGSRQVDTEHILLGLLREPQGLAAQVLTSLRLKPEWVRQEVMEFLGTRAAESPPGVTASAALLPISDRASQAIHYAQDAAERSHHEFVGTEHLLLGLIKEGTGVAATALKNLGVDLLTAQMAVEELTKAARKSIAGKLPLSAPAKDTITYAMEEARNLGHNYVGTEHVLLGLLREPTGLVEELLTGCGLKLEQVRDEIVKLLGPTH